MSIKYKWIYIYNYLRSVGGIMVSIAAFQAADPGSIPGHRSIFASSCSFLLNIGNSYLFMILLLICSFFKPQKIINLNGNIGWSSSKPLSFCLLFGICLWKAIEIIFLAELLVIREKNKIICIELHFFNICNIMS